MKDRLTFARGHAKIGAIAEEKHVTGVMDFDVAALSSVEIRAVLAGAIVVGLFYCFLGYRLFKFVLGLTGFLLAGAVAGALAGWFTEGTVIWMAVAGVAGGVAGAMALSFLYKVGVFCVGLIAGALVAHNLIGTRPEDWVASATFAATLFGGLVSLVFERAVMTLATAAIGAWIAVQSGALLLLGPMGALDNGFRPVAALAALEEGTQRLILVACWCVLATAGAFVQFASHKSRGKAA